MMTVWTRRRVNVVVRAGLCGWLGLGGTAVWAASPRELVDRGNAAYSAGRFEEALAAYEEASVDLPESAELLFNRGACYHGQGDYAKAAEAFEQAAVKTRDLALEAKCRYNLGNVAFRESERQRDGDLKKSLAACERSIRYYQEALERAPDFKEAAENIEIVRLVVKAILDEIKKQEEAAKKEQDAQKQAAEQIKQLIEKQQAASEQREALAEQKQKPTADSEALKREAQDQADAQRALQEETEQTGQNLQASPSTPSPADQARQHLAQASQKQEAAADKLEQDDLGGAGSDQAGAIDDLKKALASLAGEQEGEPQQPESDQDQSQDQQPSEGEQDPPEEGEPEDEQEEAMMPSQDEARDILEDEQDNKRRRQPARAGYRPVEKDW